MMKIVFMGTPEFSVPILKMLIKNYNVVGVVTQPDREVGRKKVLTPSPIKQTAMEFNIPVITPEKLRIEYEKVLAFKPDIIVTCAYGQILPNEILNYPKYGCINVHASLLPKYRGGAPIQRAIMNGEVKTGITIMYMNEGMDTGDMIEKKELIIQNDDNYDEVSKKLSVIGTDLLEDVLPKVIRGKIKRTIQDNEDATYAPIIKREDEKLDFNKTTFEIYNHIRALSTTPGAYAILDNKVVKIYSSRMSDHIHPNKKNGEIVKIYDDGIGISTSDSEIVITDIKIEGKNKMSVKQYLNGKNADELLGKIFE
ncbi:MAG: methionyl-tRNA formyltransferase [Bacilli bacterium]